MQILIRAFFPGTQIVSLGHRRRWTGSKGSSIFTALDTSSPVGFREDSPHLTSGRCAGHDSLCYTLSKAGSDHKNTLPFRRGKNSISLFVVRGTLLCVRLSVLRPCARWAVCLGPSGLLGIGRLKGGRSVLRELTLERVNLRAERWSLESIQQAGAETAGVPVPLCGVVGQPLGLGGVWAET